MLFTGDDAEFDGERVPMTGVTDLTGEFHDRGPVEVRPEDFEQKAKTLGVEVFAERPATAEKCADAERR